MSPAPFIDGPETILPLGRPLERRAAEIAAGVLEGIRVVRPCWPDFLGYYPDGRWCYIEAKGSGADRPSDKQRQTWSLLAALHSPPFIFTATGLMYQGGLDSRLTGLKSFARHFNLSMSEAEIVRDYKDAFRYIGTFEIDRDSVQKEIASRT